MDNERLFSWKNRWFTGSVAGVALLMLMAAAVGFIWVPKAQGRDALATLWQDICSATGVAARFRPPALPANDLISASNVIVTPAMMAPGDAQSIGRGATLAMQCTMCHGARGMAPADAPRLAGQAGAAIYKQLRDFKSGHRGSAVMQPVVANLGERDMRDLAAYYGYLPRERDGAPLPVDTPQLVSNGAPLRGIGACAACHGATIHKAAAPSLDGQPERYLQHQLRAFIDGQRHNDINEQMRNATRNMTPAEVATVAAWYAHQ